MIRWILKRLFGPKCACGHRAAKHHPSCDLFICRGWHQSVYVWRGRTVTKEEYDQLVSRH